MSDLTDAELEKWATACRGCESIEYDGFCCSGIRVPALITALRNARAALAEADALLAECGVRRDEELTWEEMVKVVERREATCQS